MIRVSLLCCVVLLLPIRVFAQSDNALLTRLHPRPQVTWLKGSGSFAIVPQARIVVSDSESVATQKAVAYLQSIVRHQIGDTLVVLTESQNDKMPAIYIGTQADFATLAHLAEASMVAGEHLDHPETYLLDVQPMTAILLGVDSNAVFDAVSTFAQFFVGPSLQIAVPSVHILDWPDYPIRWVFSQHNLQVASQVDALARIEDTMAYHKLRGLQQNDFKYNRLESVPDWYFTNVDSLHRHSLRRNVEIIPGVAPIGYSEGILLHDPDLAEGFETNTLFEIVGDSGRIVTDPSVALPNGGFEGHAGDAFTGYSYQDASGVRTFADTVVHHSGLASMRCANMTGGNTRVIRTMPCKPHRGYHLSVWAKTSAFQGYFQLLAIGTNSKGIALPLTFTQFPVASTSDWTLYNVVFNTLDNTRLSLYVGVWDNAQGTVWLDDFAIEDAGLTNILRRATTQPTVTVTNRAVPLIEGKDYGALVDSAMEQSAGNYPWHVGPNLHVPSSSLLRWGDTVNVHFWRANPVLNDVDGSGSTMVCVSEDSTYAILHDQIARVEALLHPKQFMMGHDEIRALNQDSACRSRNLSAAQVLADNLTRCDSIVHVVHAGAPTYVWSDMFDSLHNAHPNYYLVNGDLSGDWDLIPRDIAIVNWDPDKAGSLHFFAQKGFHQVTSPYYDVPNTNNIRQWRIAMEGVPNVDGMMYTTWSGDYRFLTPFADYAWSAGPMIVHKPLDSLGRSQLKDGQYLLIDAEVYPDPYDASDAIDSVTFLEHHTSLGRAVVDNVRMTNISGSSWQAATNIVTDPGTDITYEVIAKNRQGIRRATPTYLLYHRAPAASVTSVEQRTFAISPNPARNAIEVRGASGITTIEIVNALGQVVQIVTGDAPSIRIDAHQLPAGTYELRDRSNRTLVQAFVIVR